jgi:hypothetical protein
MGLLEKLKSKKGLRVRQALQVACVGVTIGGLILGYKMDAIRHYKEFFKAIETSKLEEKSRPSYLDKFEHLSDISYVTDFRLFKGAFSSIGHDENGHRIFSDDERSKGVYVGPYRVILHYANVEHVERDSLDFYMNVHGNPSFKYENGNYELSQIMISGAYRIHGDETKVQDFVDLLKSVNIMNRNPKKYWDELRKFPVVDISGYHHPKHLGSFSLTEIKTRDGKIIHLSKLEFNEEEKRQRQKEYLKRKFGQKVSP